VFLPFPFSRRLEDVDADPAPLRAVAAGGRRLRGLRRRPRDRVDQLVGFVDGDLALRQQIEDASRVVAHRSLSLSSLACPPSRQRRFGASAEARSRSSRAEAEKARAPPAPDRSCCSTSFTFISPRSRRARRSLVAGRSASLGGSISANGSSAPMR